MLTISERVYVDNKERWLSGQLQPLRSRRVGSFCHSSVTRNRLFNERKNVQNHFDRRRLGADRLRLSIRSYADEGND
jgi:hypothetical protein